MSELLVGPFGELYELSTRLDPTDPASSMVTLRDAESWSRTLDWIVDHPGNLRALRRTLMRAIPRLGPETRTLAEPRLLELLTREVASGEIVIRIRPRERPSTELLDTIPEELSALSEAGSGDPQEASESGPQPTPVAVVECILAVVAYECSHVGDRKVALRLEAGTTGADRVLEVVAPGPGDGDIITVKPEYDAEPCSTHAPKSLYVTGPGGYRETFAKGEQQVEVYHDRIDTNDLLKYLWGWNVAPVSFTLSPQVCTGSGVSATIKAYPALSAEAKLVFKLDTDDRVDTVVDRANQPSRGYHDKRGRPAFTKWRFGVSAKIKFGNQATELSLGNLESNKDANRVEQWASFNLVVKRVIDLFADKMHKYACVKIAGPDDSRIDAIRVRPMFPSLEVEYKGEYKEIVSKTTVGTAWSVKLKAAPLFGIEARVEILALIIRALASSCPGLSTGLHKFREWAKSKNQTLELYVALQGKVQGELGIEKKAELAKGNASGVLEGVIAVVFEMVASFGSSGYIGFEAGAEVKAHTGLSAGLHLDHDSRGVFLAGKLKLIGCKPQVALWASGKFIWTVKESYEREFEWWKDQDLLQTGNAYVITSN